MSTKGQAIATIIEDAGNERPTATSYKRVRKALRDLGFEGDDLREALWQMSYVDSDGEPFPWTKAKREW